MSDKKVFLKDLKKDFESKIKIIETLLDKSDEESIYNLNQNEISRKYFENEITWRLTPMAGGDVDYGIEYRDELEDYIERIVNSYCIEDFIDYDKLDFDIEDIVSQVNKEKNREKR